MTVAGWVTRVSGLLAVGVLEVSEVGLGIVVLLAAALGATVCLAGAAGAGLAAGRLAPAVVVFPAGDLVAVLAVGRGAVLETADVAAGLPLCVLEAAGLVALLAVGLTAFIGVLAAVLAFAGVAFTS
jgi:hypothetical protein